MIKNRPLPSSNDPRATAAPHDSARRALLVGTLDTSPENLRMDTLTSVDSGSPAEVVGLLQGLAAKAEAVTESATEAMELRDLLQRLVPPSPSPRRLHRSLRRWGPFGGHW